MVHYLFVICLLLYIHHVVADQMSESVQKNGYLLEHHHITTQDGYVLGLHHFLHPAQTCTKCNERKTPKPILLMHGLSSSSLNFVLYPNVSAGYYFYDHGYDVWLGNARGNKFSRNHTSLDTNDSKFWHFSFHEIGHYDLPAIIDFILKFTGHKKLIYIGHSQGGTVLMVLLSERPEYNNKICSAHIMSGAVILKYSNPLLNYITPYIDEIQNWVERFELFEWNGSEGGSQAIKVLSKFCILSFASEFCRLFLSQVLGPYSTRSYYSELPLDAASSSPSGSSYLQYFHFLQLIQSGKFQKFDHGPSVNMIVYRNAKPPEYNLTNVRTKIHIIYGQNDGLVKAENIPFLLEKIRSSVVAVNKMNSFNHLDFTVGRQVHSANVVILQVIKKIE